MGPKWAKSTVEAYDPQGSAMDQDIMAPGIQNSGNMAHKYGAEGDHSIGEVPETGLKGD